MSKCRDASDRRKVRHNVEVKKTAIGCGVFARRRFSKEAIVGEITGEIMSTDFESDYCMDLDAKAVLEPMRPFRFLNHSCTPNCELLLWKHQRAKGKKLPRLWLRAIKNIKKGQELTIDYAWPADAAIPCHCRAKKCRRWIVDPAELSQVRVRNGKRN